MISIVKILKIKIAQISSADQGNVDKDKDSETENSEVLQLQVLIKYTGCLRKMVIELWSALARYQKSFFHSWKDQAFSFRMSPFL